MGAPAKHQGCFIEADREICQGVAVHISLEEASANAQFTCYSSECLLLDEAELLQTSLVGIGIRRLQINAIATPEAHKA